MRKNRISLSLVVVLGFVLCVVLLIGNIRLLHAQGSSANTEEGQGVAGAGTANGSTTKSAVPVGGDNGQLEMKVNPKGPISCGNCDKADEMKNQFREQSKQLNNGAVQR